MEAVVEAVLKELWRRGGGEVGVAELQRAARAPVEAVQEALEILGGRRCRIERTPGGVQLAATGLACWRDILEDEARRRGMRLGRRVLVYARTASTNDVAWSHAGDAEADGLVVLAEEQTAGRGRMGHAWFAKAEQSVLLSVLMRHAGAMEALTLRAGLATARALERCVSGWRPQIKWPNDIMAEGKKLGGVLVERRGEGGAEGWLVLGIGVNVMQVARQVTGESGDFPGELAEKATSLYAATGVVVDRLRVAAAVLAELEVALAAEAGGAVDAGWLGEWKARCAMLGTHVRVRAAGRELTGRIVDVDPLRGLVLRDDGGATHFLAGQTTTFSE